MVYATQEWTTSTSVTSFFVVDVHPQKYTKQPLQNIKHLKMVSLLSA